MKKRLFILSCVIILVNFVLAFLLSSSDQIDLLVIMSFIVRTRKAVSGNLDLSTADKSTSFAFSPYYNNTHYLRLFLHQLKVFPYIA